MDEKKTVVALLDREDVEALLTNYLLEVKRLTEQMNVEESWQTSIGKEVMRLLKKCADLTEKLEELEKEKPSLMFEKHPAT